MAINDDLERDSATLERSFFGGGDAGLLAELQRKRAEEQQLELLRDVVKIHDAAFLRRLMALGVRPEVAVAVMLVPLVHLAWADGALDERERGAILDAARQRGVAAERIAGKLLASKLAQKPDARLFSAWTTYMRRLWGCFTADERWRMRTNILESARDVAEAAGGFLGLARKISAEERRVLDEIAAILD